MAGALPDPSARITTLDTRTGGRERRKNMGPRPTHAPASPGCLEAVLHAVAAARAPDPLRSENAQRTFRIAAARVCCFGVGGTRPSRACRAARWWSPKDV